LIIESIIIEPYNERKIYNKHKVTTREIKQVLKENAPIYGKVGGEQYMAIGHYERYVTIFFIYDKETKSADVQTAYPSSKWQIKLYKRKK